MFLRTNKADDTERMLEASKWPAYVSVSQWYFKPSHMSNGDIGESNGGDQASKTHPMQPSSSRQQPTAITGCNDVLDDEQKSDGSNETTVNYMSLDQEGPVQ